MVLCLETMLVLNDLEFCLDLAKGKCNCSCNGTFHKGSLVAKDRVRFCCSCPYTALWGFHFGFFFFFKDHNLKGQLGNCVRRK